MTKTFRRAAGTAVAGTLALGILGGGGVAGADSGNLDPNPPGPGVPALVGPGVPAPVGPGVPALAGPDDEDDLWDGDPDVPTWTPDMGPYPLGPRVWLRSGAPLVAYWIIWDWI